MSPLCSFFAESHNQKKGKKERDEEREFLVEDIFSSLFLFNNRLPHHLFFPPSLSLSPDPLHLSLSLSNTPKKQRQRGA